jgi:hypothetical protein
MIRGFPDVTLLAVFVADLQPFDAQLDRLLKELA